MQDYQDSETFFEPETFMARVQDETLATRKKLTSGFIETNTNSATASLACVASVALIVATNVTAEVDDFMSQQLDEVSVGIENAVKKWDIQSQFGQKTLISTTQQPSGYKAASATTSDLISFIRNHVRLAYSASLANRLEYLRDASIEEAPEQAPISVNSLQCFVSFIKSEPNLAEPDIVLTYTGNIRAEWHKSRKQHFAVEFLPNGQARYVVFSRDPDHPTRTDRTSGVVSAETLMVKVKPFNVIPWAAS